MDELEQKEIKGEMLFVNQSKDHLDPGGHGETGLKGNPGYAGAIGGPGPRGIEV